MKFDPKTEEDLKRETLLDPGTYDFEVMKSEDAVSKTSGKEMIAITLRLFSDRGERTVRDWLMPSMGFKLRHFAETTGLLAKYDAGTMNANDCLGRTGKVILVIKDSEQYGPQNNVKDYEKAKAGAEPAMVPTPKPALPKAGAATDSDIPFARPLDSEVWG
jgi:hypothetical protein